jgi:hypothetical protein
MVVRDHLPWLRLWPQISLRLGLKFILDTTIAAACVCDGLTFLAVPSLASTGFGLIFIRLDRIGREIDAPFETTVQDTPMTSLSRTIEVNLRQLLGERALKELHPVAGFVY